MVPLTVKVPDAGAAGPFALAGEVGQASAGWRAQTRLPVESVVGSGVSMDQVLALEVLRLSGGDLRATDAA